MQVIDFQYISISSTYPACKFWDASQKMLIPDCMIGAFTSDFNIHH